jgi:hypothetical protein
MTIRILALLLAFSLALPLAGCGRKGLPGRPENAIYPRIYPSDSDQPEAAPPAEPPEPALPPRMTPPTFQDLR